jgi:hypothetical protein
MSTKPVREDSTAPAGGDLEEATKHRRDADLRLSMNERLAALHHLCVQASQIGGAAKRSAPERSAEPD